MIELVETDEVLDLLAELVRKDRERDESEEEAA